eukprot:scaffold180_cov311-Pinguiococcus_pyrenoidosus.AAC.28
MGGRFMDGNVLGERLLERLQLPVGRLRQRLLELLEQHVGRPGDVLLRCRRYSWLLRLRRLRLGRRLDRRDATELGSQLHVRLVIMLEGVLHQIRVRAEGLAAHRAHAHGFLNILGARRHAHRLQSSRDQGRELICEGRTVSATVVEHEPGVWKRALLSLLGAEKDRRHSPAV